MAKKLYTLRYRRTTLRFKKNPRKKKCECCGRKGKLDAHHWIYKYKTSEIKKNPNLALENISTLCFSCHRLANSLKHIMENPELITKLSELVPLEILMKYSMKTMEKLKELYK